MADRRGAAFLRYVGRCTASAATGLVALAVLAGAASLAVGLRRLGPGQAAIVREVFGRTGALFGPHGPPYRLRVVVNPGSASRWFWVQPPPFGAVEDLVALDRPITVEAVTSRWSKDLVTGQGADRRWARELRLVLRLPIEDVERFARATDPFDPSNRPDGSSPAAGSREGVLQGRVRRAFEELLDFELARLARDLPGRLQFLQRELPFEPDEPAERRLSRWEAYAEAHPWLLLTGDGLSRVQQERPDMLQRLAVILQLQAAGIGRDELDEPLRQAVEEARAFYGQYVATHPGDVDREVWRWLIASGSPELSGPALAVRFVEAHLEWLGDRLRRKLADEGFDRRHGVAIGQPELTVEDRPVDRYPTLSSARGAPGDHPRGYSCDSPPTPRPASPCPT